MPRLIFSTPLVACLAIMPGFSNKGTPTVRQTIHQVVTTEAVLYPIRQASIMPKISAPVAKFLVQRGDHVREGQRVAMLEDRDLVAAAQESRQMYEQAEAALSTVLLALGGGWHV